MIEFHIRVILDDCHKNFLLPPHPCTNKLARKHVKTLKQFKTTKYQGTQVDCRDLFTWRLHRIYMKMFGK